MKHYSQLTLEQRYIIYSMLKIGLTQLKIAEVIGIHKSTVIENLNEIVVVGAIDPNRPMHLRNTDSKLKSVLKLTVALGLSSIDWYAKNGVLSKSAVGWRKTWKYLSVMNGFTNTFLKINWLVVLCIFIYVAKRKERSVMDPMNDGASLRIESA